MKTIWLHGLESKAGGERVDYLNGLGECYAPPMNYYEDGIYKKTLDAVREFKPDLVIGSSIGGYFAFHIGEALGVNTLLFNPALPYRTKDNLDIPDNEKVFSGVHHTVILGVHDDVIIPADTVAWLGDKFDCTVKYADMTHRTDFKVFVKEVNYLIP